MSITLRATTVSARARVGRVALFVLLANVSSVAIGQSSKPARSAPKATQTTQPSQPTLDPRWTPWLGCWRSDATSPSAPVGSTTCVVPLAGSTGVEELSISGGKVLERHRFEADGRPHPMQESGCSGTRTSQWSPGGRRVYVRSEYTCDAGFSGVSTSIIALSSTGDFLESEHVRAGRGSVEHITHLRDAGLPDGVPADVISVLATRRLAITTARAAAIAPLASEDVLEALQQVDVAAVRAWLTENGQRFTLNGDQIAALIHADVPQSVLQAMVGWAPQQNAGQAPGMGQDYTTRSNTGGGIVVYGSAPAEMQRTSNGLYCNASGCYSENPYSGYNGYNGFVYSPYQYDGYPYYPSFSYPYAYIPPVIFPNRGRFGQNRFNGPFGINRPVVHAPGGGVPMTRGGQPVPRGGQPPVQRPVGQPGGRRP